MNKQALGKKEIEALIPHTGTMCLLDRVLSFSNLEIVCQTQTHLASDNPLKSLTGLSKIHLIEYGAQTIAIHGGLVAGRAKQPRIGYIAMVKSVKWGRFNAATEFLTVSSKIEMADDSSKLYTFTISDAEHKEVCSGRVMVVHPTLGEL